MIETVALGIVLRWRAAADGGRVGPIAASRSTPFTYRPNWGLPSMAPPDQTGAPVFGFSASPVPGGSPVRAFIVVPYPQMTALWQSEVVPGTMLPMYDGPHIHGVGTVAWSRVSRFPPRMEEAGEFTAW